MARFPYVTNDGPYDVRECPCGEELKVLPGQDEVECPECNKHWAISVDAEFDDGIWRDLTYVTEMTPDVAAARGYVQLIIQRKAMEQAKARAAAQTPFF